MVVFSVNCGYFSVQGLIKIKSCYCINISVVLFISKFAIDSHSNVLLTGFITVRLNALKASGGEIAHPGSIS